MLNSIIDLSERERMEEEVRRWRNVDDTGEGKNEPKRGRETGTECYFFTLLS